MIKKLLSYTKEDSLIRDGFILFIATMFANLAAFLYHFYMGRVLGPEGYGVLGVILSLVYIFNVPNNLIQTTVTKFSADLLAKKKQKEMDKLQVGLVRVLLWISFGIFVLFLVLARLFLADFLGITFLELVAFSPYIIIAIIIPIYRGFLQGEQRFKQLGGNIVLEAALKMLLGVALVELVFKNVLSAIIAVSLSSLIALVLILKYKRSFNSGFGKNKGRYDFLFPLLKYSVPVLFTLTLLTLSYTIDVFLVKHYFSSLDSGYYAAVSLIGKMIFFATMAIPMAMFPKVSSLHANSKKTFSLLVKSLGLVVLIGGASVLAMYVLPSLIVKTLLGDSYIEIIGKIWLFGLAMLFFSVIYLLSFYNLAKSRYGFLFVLFIWIILEIVLIVLMHASLMGVIMDLLAVNLVALVFLLAYTLIKK